MSVPLRRVRGKYDERPNPCRACGSSAWWDGRRLVSQVVRDSDGVVQFVNTVRRRACCSSKICTAPGWTVYEFGGYPYRLFQLFVLVSAVLAVAVGAATHTASAQAYRCSRRSIGRWRHWVSNLAEPKQLFQSCSRLDSQGLPPPILNGPREGVVLGLLERLAELFYLRSVPLHPKGPGLIRILAHQFSRFGDIFFLTRSSPPLRVSLETICM